MKKTLSLARQAVAFYVILQSLHNYIKSVYLYLPPISMSYFAGKVGMAVGCLKKYVVVSHTVIS